jgi:hypothetical protein
MARAHRFDLFPQVLKARRRERSCNHVGMAIEMLVAECITRSAPMLRGCKIEVRNRRTTASVAPAPCAISAMAAMSLIAYSGLPGVSI